MFLFCFKQKADSVFLLFLQLFVKLSHFNILTSFIAGPFVCFDSTMYEANVIGRRKRSSVRKDKHVEINAPRKIWTTKILLRKHKQHFACFFSTHGSPWLKKKRLLYMQILTNRFNNNKYYKQKTLNLKQNFRSSKQSKIY